ncbi:MAG: redoxin domain-containing protein [Myxococcales bacterium]|nr:redoxin domain-containing protein [Myxococcales bacterium]
MKSSVVAVLASSLLLFGCNDPEMDQRIADLEAKVEALEKRPGGAGGAGAATPEQEQAAAALLKEATQAAEAMDVDSAKGKLEELRGKYAMTRAARAAQRLESELSVVGKDEASLDVEKWYQGSAADVSGGKATLYVFWEVWCPHCKREVPKLSATYDKFKGQGLTMVGLTKQTRNITDDQVSEFVNGQGVSYPIAKESGDELSQHYGVRGIPAAAMVKDGKVVWRGHPARLTDDMISKWLGS